MKHTAYSFDALTIAINEMIARLPELAGVINKFSARELNPVEIKQLAQSAYDLRGGGRVATEDELADILQVRRPEDAGTNLWVVMNRLQESIVRGGQAFVDARGRVRSMKPLLNLDKSLKANQELWSLAESFA